MTISIKITNTDTRENAVVAVHVQSTDGDAVERNPEGTLLKGGESVEKYVHSGQRLVVDGVRNG